MNEKIVAILAFAGMAALAIASGISETASSVITVIATTILILGSIVVASYLVHLDRGERIVWNSIERRPRRSTDQESEPMNHQHMIRERT